jgi:hypothetical protein
MSNPRAVRYRRLALAEDDQRKADCFTSSPTKLTKGCWLLPIG